MSELIEYLKANISEAAVSAVMRLSARQLL